MTVAEVENIKKYWLGEFPEHWQVLRIKNLFREIDNRSVNGDEELLSVSQYTGITPKRDSLENEDDFISNAETLENYKKVAVGDLVINIMLAWNGSLGISPYDGITSPAYCVYRCLPGNNPEYFGYLYSTALFKCEFRRNSTGIIDSRLRLYSDKFFSIFSVVPPKEEQDLIVEHIKTQSEKINRFIAAKKNFIELLKEQRQGIINHAVTKGMNPKAKMKPSGIGWLGDIPEHWELRRLRYLGRCQNGLNKSEEYFGSGYPFLSYSDVYKNESLPNDLSGLAVSTDEDRVNYSVMEGDIFFTRTSEIIEEIGISSICMQSIPNATFSGFLIRLRPLEGFLFNGFSKYYFRSQLLRSYFIKEMNIVTRASLSQNLLKNLPVLIPSFEEQQQIVEYVNNETATIDTAISKTEREIELIKEYKQSLIAEVVTGKIKIS
jgi:type I restriction enzyme, S subunit